MNSKAKAWAMHLSIIDWKRIIPIIKAERKGQSLAKFASYKDAYLNAILPTESSPNRRRRRG